MSDKIDTDLIVFPNPDKPDQDKDPNPFLPNIPFRMCITGKPGTGKRNLLLNIIMKYKKAFDRVMVIHLDNTTLEYDILKKRELYTPEDPEMPNFDNLDVDKNNLIIIDEVAFKSFPKAIQSQFERLLNYGSTHKNTSIIISIQNMFDIPPSIRRACNHYILAGKVSDKDLLSSIARRVGVPKEEMQELQKLVRNKYDSIWIDLQNDADSELRYRLNLFYPIKRKDKD